MSEVTDILDDAKQYANDMKEAAAKAVEDIVRILQKPDGPGTHPPAEPDLPLKFTPTQSPTLGYTPPVFNPPLEPGGMEPYFIHIDGIDPGGAPEDGSKKPTIEKPTKPSALRTFTYDEPSIKNNFNTPPEPNYQIPERPTIDEHAPIEPPEIHIPDFTAHPPGAAELPEVKEDIRSLIENTQKLACSSAFLLANEHVDVLINKLGPDLKRQLETISSRLEQGLRGSTGLDASVENAIYERAKGKNRAEEMRVRDTTLADMAGRGFTLPSGAMVSMIQRARQAAADNNARAASEIAVQQAELEQKNLQFAVNTLVALRTTVVNASVALFQSLVALNAQSLEHAKAVLSGVIEAYNTGAKRFELMNEVFKAEIALHDIEAKAATLALDVYRGELAALESAVNIDSNKVAIYKAEIEASTLAIAAFKAQADAVISTAGLEKMKIDLAALRVQAYQAEVQAKEAEWRGYTAEMQGEEAKARIYATEVEGFRGRVAAFSAEVQAMADAAKAQAATNEAMSMTAKAAVDVYMARIEAEKQKVAAQMDGEKAKLLVDIETIKSNLGIDDLRLKYEIALMENKAAEEKLKNEIDLAEAQQETVRMQTTAQVSSILATTLGGMAQAAMSGMNVLAAQTETI